MAGTKSAGEGCYLGGGSVLYLVSLSSAAESSESQLGRVNARSNIWRERPRSRSFPPGDDHVSGEAEGERCCIVLLSPPAPPPPPPPRLCSIPPLLGRRINSRSWECLARCTHTQTHISSIRPSRCDSAWQTKADALYKNMTSTIGLKLENLLMDEQPSGSILQRPNKPITARLNCMWFNTYTHVKQHIQVRDRHTPEVTQSDGSLT